MDDVGIVCGGGGEGGKRGKYFEGFGGDFGPAVIAAEDDDVVCRWHIIFGEIEGGKLRVCMLRRSWVREICTYLYLTKVPYVVVGKGGRGLFLPKSGILFKSGTTFSCQTLQGLGNKVNICI